MFGLTRFTSVFDAFDRPISANRQRQLMLAEEALRRAYAERDAFLSENPQGFMNVPTLENAMTSARALMNASSPYCGKRIIHAKTRVPRVPLDPPA